jgi:hypothetical protein
MHISEDNSDVQIQPSIPPVEYVSAGVESHPYDEVADPIKLETGLTIDRMEYFGLFNFSSGAVARSDITKQPSPRIRDSKRFSKMKFHNP